MFRASLMFLLAVVIGTTVRIGYAQSDQPAPRLVLQITVDGLRGDFLDRGKAHFGPGGFNRLLTAGTYYRNAHYRHANTETIVGHATLATGASPAVHGLIGNAWFDRRINGPVYNIEDKDFPLLASRKKAGDAAQVDPAQLLSTSQGRSPRSLLVNTFGDELKLAHNGKAKIFAVSGKDRSAVAMAGHGGKAFWMSIATGDFVTSSYYYADYPDWAAQWNARRQGESWAGKSWDLLLEKDRYLRADKDDRPFEVDLKGYGRVFPHPFGSLDDRLFFTRLLVSPIGDVLTADFAKTLIEAEQLGSDEIPDYLSVSFSGVDAVSHFFGPASLESEDVVTRLDRTLADLLDFVDQRVGLDKTLIVLAADHGMAEMPEEMAAQGFAVGRIYTQELVEEINSFGREKYGVEKLTRFFYRPYLTLDQAAIRTDGHDPVAVEKAVVAFLNAKPGIAEAIRSADLPYLQSTYLVDAVRRNYHPERSGAIYLVQQPYWYLFEKGAIGVMHGSPWRYDTYVPIAFRGPGVPTRISHRPVHPMDVAPTLAALMKIKPPAAAEGQVLPEVMGQID